MTIANDGCVLKPLYGAIVMPIDKNLLDRLLHEEEGSALDFKRDQYSFDRADDNAKSELLKDILAFANAWRRVTAYILIGVDEVKGGRSKIVGVKAHLDDAQLHQFVNSKTQRRIEFSYQPFSMEGVEIGVIEIPIQERPVYLKKKFGKIEKNAVYKRDGSSTAIATPDEVARMGAKQDFGSTPELVLEWANIDRHVVLPSPHTVTSLFLDPQLPEDTFKKPRSSSDISNFQIYDHDDPNYSDKVIWYAFWMAFLKPVGLRLHNLSGVVGKRVRFIGSVTKNNTSFVLDKVSRPRRPYRHGMGGIAERIVPLARQLRPDPDPCVQKLADGWEITIDFGDIRPRDEIWTTSPLLIGSGGGITKLEGELRGDNIPEPIPCALEINFDVEVRAMEKSDVEPYLDAR